MTEAASLLEPQVNVPVIEFEPGEHPTKREDYSFTNQAIDNGDLTAHLWNLEVARRIKARAFTSSALVLALDSDAPEPHLDHDVNILFRSGANFRSWSLLPARPSELNSSNAVYVLRADTNDNAVPLIARDGRRLSDTSLNPNLQGSYISEANMLVEASKITEGFVRAASYLGIMKGVTEIGKKIKGNRPEGVLFPSGKMSRRGFLRWAGIGGAGLFLAASPKLGEVALSQAAKAPDDYAKKIWQKVDQIASAKLFLSSWVDARTGLLYSKMEDLPVADLPLKQDTDYTIVMGYGHEPNQDHIKTDKKARNEAIHSYAQNIIKDGKEAYALYEEIPKDQVPPEAINRLLDYLSLAELVKITDPGGGDKNPDFTKNIENYFSTVKTFHSPQIEEAIKDLRPR